MSIIAKNVLLPNVQVCNPDVLTGLTRVGVTGVREMVEITRSDKPSITMVSTFDIFVDKQSYRKWMIQSPGTRKPSTIRSKTFSLGQSVESRTCVSTSPGICWRDMSTQSVPKCGYGEYLLKTRSPKSNLACQEVYEIWRGGHEPERRCAKDHWRGGDCHDRMPLRTGDTSATWPSES